MPPRSRRGALRAPGGAGSWYRTCEAADALTAKATELREFAERLEELTEGNDDAWYAVTRTRVEATMAVEQAEELRGALVKLGERLSE